MEHKNKSNRYRLVEKKHSASKYEKTRKKEEHANLTTLPPYPLPFSFKCKRLKSGFTQKIYFI